VLFWLGVFVVLVLAFALLQGVLMPFAAAFVIAYFLDPLVDRLQMWRISRGLASLMILLGFLLGVGLILFLLVCGIFIFGQTVEANLLTPKLAGDRIHLHQVWVIFALLAGGKLFGFLGVLVSVPAAAVIGVLVRFALDRYRHSVIYDLRAQHTRQVRARK
jgi:predicted PurR-regulated permease PerM